MTVLYYCTVQQFGVEQMAVLYSTKMAVHNFCGWARSRRCCWLDPVYPFCGTPPVRCDNFVSSCQNLLHQAQY